jgi:hypothetical protein
MQGRSLLAQRSIQVELRGFFTYLFWTSGFLAARARTPISGLINRPKGALRVPIAASLILIHSSKTNYFQKQNALLRPQTRVVRGVYLIMSLKFWTIELSNLANVQRRIFVILFVYHRERRMKARKETARYFWVAEWLKRLTANAGVATVPDSISESSDTMESQGRQIKQCRRQ